MLTAVLVQEDRHGGVSVVPIDWESDRAQVGGA